VIFFANVVDCLIRSMIALFVQIIVYYIVKIAVPNCPSGSRPANSQLRASVGPDRAR
jgi:putative membrane protein